MNKIKILVLLGVFFFISISFYINRNRVILDGVNAEVLSLILMSDTKYSMGYSHEKFNQIKIGMKEKEVLDLIGEPLNKWKPYLNSNFYLKKDYIGFEYSTSPSSGSYRLRQINFSNGKAVEIIHYFYID